MDEGAGTICTCRENECCSLCPTDETPETYDGYMWGDND